MWGNRMGGLRKQTIAKRLAAAIELSGATVSEGSFRGGRNTLPWRCTVRFPGGMERSFAMYFWTVTHGGRGRPEGEYRIQTTLKSGNSLEVSGATTLMLGYYEWGDGDRLDRNDFKGIVVAWNALNHLEVGRSSSCQVKFGAIKEAARVGVVVYERTLADGIQEKVVSVREDLFARYLVAASGGHGSVTEDGLRNSSYVRRQF